MIVHQKQSCPTCGQSVNTREISLFDEMIDALFVVWQWCEEKNRYKFTRKDIKAFLDTENKVARFGDWVFFGGLVYKEKKGQYGLNVKRVRSFFSGNLAIPTKAYKNPLTEDIVYFEQKTIKDIPSLQSLLADNEEFIVQYHGELIQSDFPLLEKKEKRRKKKGRTYCPKCDEQMKLKIDGELNESNNMMIVTKTLICPRCSFTKPLDK